MGTLSKVLRFLGVFVALVCANVWGAHAEFNIYLNINDNGATTSSEYSGLYYNDDDATCETDRYYNGISCKFPMVTEFNAPTKTGFKYLGHYTLQTGGRLWAEPIANGKTRIVQGYGPNNNATVYAHWGPIKITLNHQSATTNGAPGTLYLKGGTGGGWYRDEAMTQPITALDTVPIKNGYTFLGYWTTQYTGGTQVISTSGNLLTSQQVLNAFTDDATIYARWIQNHTVTLNPNGGTPTANQFIYTRGGNFYSDSTGTQRITSSIFNSIANGGANITQPTLTNSTFNGYWTTATGGTQTIDAAGNILVSQSYNSGQTWYAHYEDDVYVVNLRANGGTPDNIIYYKESAFYCDAAATILISSGQDIFTRCNSVTKPTNGNETFTGYYSATSGGTKYIDSDGKILTAAYSYNFGGEGGTRWFAQYESTCDTTIILNPNGGTFTGTCPDEFHPYLSGGQWLSPTLDSGCTPTRPGYTFAGYIWTDGGGGTYYNANLNPTYTVWPLCDQAKVVLTASWEGNCNLITFNDNNANNTNVNANNTQRKRSGATDWLDADPVNPNLCGKPLTTNPTVATPTNANATFLGYYTALTGGTQVFNSSGATTTAGNNWTITSNTTLYAHWRCNTGYEWNATTHACEQNTFSVKYMCYVGDTGTVDNSVTATNYAVRPITFAGCNINANDFDAWLFSADNATYAPGDIISQWTYGNNENFVPRYKAMFNCDTEHWMAPNAGNPNSQDAKLGGSITMPTMNCVPRPQYEGWVNTNSQWNYAYDHNMTSPVPDAICTVGDFTVNGGAAFNWQCPTHLTFTPDDELITKTITVSCGTGGTTGQIPINYGDDVSALVGQWLATNCTGSCQNPSGPSHGYWKFCGVWENGAVPNVTPIPGETGCYRAETPYDLDQIAWEDVTTFNITTISHCPKYVKYKCSDDATNEYTDSTYSYFEEPYTVLDHITTLCTDSGYEFDRWKVENEDVYYNENQTVAEWPYETEVALVAQWGDAIDYTVTYTCGAGTGANTTDTATYGTDYTVLNLGQTNCTYTGHTFLGWVFSGNNNTYNGGETFNWTYANDNQTFTAQWSGVNTYTITYVMNGGDWPPMSYCPGAQGCPSTYTYGVGATINVVPTRPLSEFLGWCTDSALTDCDMTQVIGTTDVGNKTFWAKWDCVSPYHPDPNDPSVCVACEDNTWWNPNTQTCESCPSAFPYSRAPYTWSERQCYRPCQDGVQCNANIGTMLSGIPSNCHTELFPSGITTQIEFKGNYDDGIQTCGGAVPNCPWGFTTCGSGAAYKPMVAPVDFHGKIPEQDLGTRYIFGSRAGSGSIDLTSGAAWSQIAGSGQKTNVIHNNVGGVMMDYYYTHILYPTDAAPDATVPGYTFNGYYYPRTGGTRYVESNYLLDATNAQSILGSQPGDSNTARHLYATLENGGYTQDEYTITYNCGTATGGTTPAQQTGIHYGDSVTPRANTCTKPGYNFLGWMVSNTTDTQQPGVAFTWQYGESKTFTAKWSDTPIDYTITYDCGTATGGTTPAQQTGIHYGDSVTPRNNTCEKPGYNFLGWMVSNTTDIKQPGVAFTWQYEESKTFTAKWNDDPNDYVITYKPNYTGATQQDVTQVITYGQQFTTHGAIFTRPGHIMTGWSEPFPLLNNTYTYNVADDTTLNAQWQICPDGTQPNATGTACEPCPEGEAGLGGICNPCPDGTQPNEAGTACEPCPEGTAGTGGTCEPCPDGTQPNEAGTACEPCPEGTAGTGGTCEPCPDGTQPNEAGTACEPCPEGEAGLGGICNPCPAGTQPNATGTACEPCPDGQYSVNGVCMPCPAGQTPNANGDGCEPCPDGQYSVNGVCMPCPDGYQPNASGDGCEPCPAGTYGTGGTCEPCPEGYSSNPGATSIDQCFVSECPAGQHIEHGECKDDVVECGAPHAAYATRTWNPTLMAYGSCQIQECIDGYHISSNACVLDEQFCAVPNGRGEREWNGNAWGPCQVTLCDPGFENTGTACSECANRRVNGEIAVSSYATECEIATCMYHGQKYILENNECRPICEDATDETGTKHWDNVAKKCVRTCNPGYKMW